MNINIDDIIKVHNKIRSEIRWTETSFSQSLSEKTGSKIFLKFDTYFKGNLF